MISIRTLFAVGLTGWLSLGCGDDGVGNSDGSPFEEGIASYYADSLAGQLMANGEPYDPTQDTCAHRTLAFGTRVSIERVSNGVEAICTVTDRGPFVDGRIIDVSRNIAETLDMIQEGIVDVRIYLIDG